MNERKRSRFSMWDPHDARRSLAILMGAVSVALIVAGLSLAAYAGVQWLQTARWQPLTVSGVLTSWPATREWVAHPRGWLGLHRVVMWVRSVPLFVIVTLLGAFLLVLSPPVTRSPTWQDAW
jgi:hypothetical protein